MSNSLFHPDFPPPLTEFLEKITDLIGEKQLFGRVF